MQGDDGEELVRGIEDEESPLRWNEWQQHAENNDRREPAMPAPQVIATADNGKRLTHPIHEAL